MATLPRIIGHRGAAAVAPENTIAGFEAAAAGGAVWVECDVSLLGDGTAVIFHDATLDRTTDGTGALADADWARVAALDAGRWFSARFAGTPVPRLDDALAALRRLGLGVNLEMKTHRRETGHGNADAGERLAEVVAAHLGRSDDPGGGVLVSSFNHGALGAFRNHDRNTPVALLYGEVRPDWDERTRALDAAGVVADHRRLTRTVVTAVRDAGRFVGAYTVNDAVRARTLWDWGVASVFTDRPGDLLG